MFQAGQIFLGDWKGCLQESKPSGMQQLRMTFWKCQKTAEPSRNDTHEQLKGSDANPQLLAQPRGEHRPSPYIAICGLTPGLVQDVTG